MPPPSIRSPLPVTSKPPAWTGVQAEAVAAAIRAGQGDLATRADLRAELAGLDTRIVSLEARIYRAMLVQAFAIAGAVIAVIKLIP